MMEAPTEKAKLETMQRGSLSDSLAAERTYLAWIRTGLALLGLGFVVAIWIVSGEALLPGACYAGAFVWTFGVVWNGSDTGRGGCVSFVGLELCAADSGVEPGRGGGCAAVGAGGAGGGVFGFGGTGGGGLFDFW